MSLLQQIKSLSEEYFDFSIKNRRFIHANPELSYHEFNTAKYISRQLFQMGLTPREGIAGTGLIVLIEGNNPDSKTVALRADMDALPIVELNEVEYKSNNPGVMHACGHDVHTASLITVAKILNQVKNKFEGSVKLVFQPAEEKAPGGASLMIKEGVLKNPDVSSIIGQHVAPNLPVGTIGFREGMYMASTDEIYLRVKGKGGHGAAPHLAVDPVLIASNIIVSLQQIVSRHRSPESPSVLTFGKVIAEGATNIIPSEVYIEGTFRCMDEVWRAKGIENIEKIAKGMAEAMGGSCDFWIEKGYPFLQNQPELTKRLKTCAQKYVGKDNVIDLDLWMGGEDFAFYSQKVDACFYRLGTRNESKGIVSGVHTPTFDIDEDALKIGPGLMAYMAIEELSLA
jgi:amidohydrolase